MKKSMCIICGQGILKSGLHDPFICRGCEQETDRMELSRYWHLDNS